MTATAKATTPPVTMTVSVSGNRLLAYFFMFALILLSILGSAAGAAPTYQEVFYMHGYPSSYTVGSVGTGGSVFNTSAPAAGAATVTRVGAGGYAQNWYYTLLMPGALTVEGVPRATLYLSSSVDANWSYTIQVIEATSAGATVAVLSTATGKLDVSTTAAAYQVTNFGAITSTVFSQGNILQLSIDLSGSSATVYFDFNSQSAPSSWTLPLSVAPVSVGPVSFVGSAAYVGTGSVISYQFTVNDSLGQYDLASVQGWLTSPGGYIYSDNASVGFPGFGPDSFSQVYQAVAANVVGGVYFVHGSATDNSGQTFTDPNSAFTVVTDTFASAIWGGLLALASLFLVLAFVIPAKFPAGQGWKRSPAGEFALMLRTAFFPLIDAIIWFLVAYFSATLGVFINVGLLYLFYGLTLVMGLVFVGNLVLWFRESFRPEYPRGGYQASREARYGDER